MLNAYDMFDIDITENWTEESNEDFLKNGIVRHWMLTKNVQSI